MRGFLILVAICLMAFAFPGWCENLLLNPSFEVGRYGWTWSALPLSIYPESMLHVSMDRETPTAGPALGTASLKISGDKGLYSASLISAMAALTPAANYTFSFYAKASAPMQVSVWAFAPALEGRVTLIDKKISIGKEWQRFSVGFDAKVLEGKRGARGIHSQMESANVFRVSINMPYSMPANAVIWLDGMQLAPGELAEYDDGKPIMAGPESTKYDNTYEPGEKIDPVFYFYRSSA